MERRAGQPEFIDAIRYVQDAEIVRRAGSAAQTTR
jgi:hypothetical protein